MGSTGNRQQMLDEHMHIQSGTWHELCADLKPIREQVFIQEQNIAAEDEWDDLDVVSTHFVVYEHEKAIATARLLANHSIGRVAVLKSHRGLNIGQKLMQAVIEYALQQKRPFLFLSSQVYAIGFYQRLGFMTEGEEYLDCGIPHINMKRTL